MTEKFPWKPEYDLGIAIIDEQHRGFVSILNEVVDLIDRHAVTRDGLVNVLNGLSDYAVHHFTTEEGYFAEFDYDGTDEHVATHEQFCEKISDYASAVQGSSGADYGRLAEDIAKYADWWLTDHIQHVDRLYTECFHQHGLK